MVLNGPAGTEAEHAVEQQTVSHLLALATADGDSGPGSAAEGSQIEKPCHHEHRRPAHLPADIGDRSTAPVIAVNGNAYTWQSQEAC